VDIRENNAMEILGKPGLAYKNNTFCQAMPLLEGSATLLRRSQVESHSSATLIYCLMVFKQVDFYDAGAIEDIVAEGKARGVCHTVTLGCPVTDSIVACKGRFDDGLHINMLERWIRELHPCTGFNYCNLARSCGGGFAIQTGSGRCVFIVVRMLILLHFLSRKP
jgi:hypothetical protein